MSADTVRAECAFTKRVDGHHAWVFDGDDPYVICHFCQEQRDAQTGRVIRQGKEDTGG